MKNWKTNLAALLLALLAMSTAMGWLTPEQAAAIGTTLAAFGFAAAKDFDKSGTK